MDIQILNDVLSEDDMLRITESIDLDIANRPKLYKVYPDKSTDVDHSVAYLSGTGRIDARHPNIPQDIIEKISKAVEYAFKDDPNIDPAFSFSIYAEYSKKSGGNPELGPHLDISENKDILILDYQLKSNTSWHIGIGYEIFSLKDNSALLFNPAIKVHYRPKKIFNDEESVKMIFFRFVNKKSREVNVSKMLNKRDPKILKLYNYYYNNLDSGIM